MTLGDQIAKSMKTKKKNTPRETSHLSSGSRILNLAISGRPDVAYRKGRCHSIVGDTSSGKSVLACSAFAEASVNPAFKDYAFEFADIEGGSLVDMVRYYGKAAMDRINSWSAETLEDFYDRADTLLKSQPTILILDSWDILAPLAQEEQIESGSKSYGTDKAKINSARLRRLDLALRKKGSIFIGISQTRQNVGWNSQFSPKTYSGGDAIKFYSRIQFWTSIRENLVHPKHQTQQGIVTQIKITKNHFTGWQGKLEVPILRGSGVDDIGSCIDFLVNAKHWKTAKKEVEGKRQKRTAGVIDAQDLGESLPREDLVAYIEDNDLESVLEEIVVRVWNQIESETIIRRKQKY